MPQSFEWDDDKAEANASKHGVTFNLAALVFGDPARITRTDERFDYDEERSITTGSIYGILHVVVHTDRGDSIRIISARRATRRERRAYGHDPDHG